MFKWVVLAIALIAFALWLLNYLIQPKGALKNAVSAQQAGRLREAIPYFTEWLALNPNDWRALCGLGQAEQDLGQLDQAEAHYRRCLDLNPKSVESKEGLALLWAERDKGYERSLQALAETADAVTDVPEVYASVQLEIAYVHYLKGDTQAALPPFEAYLSSLAGDRAGQPEKDAFWAAEQYHAGVLHHALKSDTERAAACLRQAIQLSPESTYAARAKELLAQIAPPP